MIIDVLKNKADSEKNIIDNYKEYLFDSNMKTGTGGICQYSGKYCSQLGSNICERCRFNTSENDN